ncbi:MAG: chemotaxis protein CheW [Gemmatimonadaceae bacterium]
MDPSRYAELFLTESRENLSAVNHHLLALERAAPGSPAAEEAVGALFRAVHTVKGMSATMGYASVAELTHELETLLDRVRRGAQAVTPAIMDALFRSADVLEESIEAVVRGAAPAGVAAAIARLREASAASAPPAAPVAAEPDAAHADAGDWSAVAPAGDGLLVRVRVAEEALMRGVRAFMALERGRSLGIVTAASHSDAALQAGEYGADFAFRLVTDADRADIERAVRSAGDVERVLVLDPADERAASAHAAPEPPASAAAPAGGVHGDAAAALEEPYIGTAAESTPHTRQARNVRIDLRRLDNLMNLIGELVITRGRLLQVAAGVRDAALEETVRQASRLIGDLQDEIMTSRLVPVWQVFDRFPRLVRDAARALGKQVNFVIEGKDIEIDRSMLDEIGDPIVHLLRNAIDHGIEPPAARLAAGKPAAGTLRLTAARERSAVVVRVSDDGRGIDRGKVLAKAKAARLVDQSKLDLSDDELVRLISRAGFSTADAVTDISGRGVGIDAVQSRVRALGGALDIRSAAGHGTTIALRLPLTLAIVRALLARVGDEVYALPMTHVSETVELDQQALRRVRGREVLVLRDDVLPVVRLRDVVRLPAGEDRLRQVVILDVAERRAGLVVDELAGQQEIVVKQFDGVRGGLAVFSGATILGDGAPALIVDVASLL